MRQGAARPTLLGLAVLTVGVTAAPGCDDRPGAWPLAERPPESVVMPPAGPGAAEAARLPLRPAGGSTVTGMVDLEETPTGVQLWVSVTAPRGFYAVHLRGRPDCADVAGSDARTTNRGERIGVLAVTDAGSGTFERRVDGASLDDVSKPHSLFGRSVVLFRQNHLAPPRSDGERAVACGPISR